MIEEDQLATANDDKAPMSDDIDFARCAGTQRVRDPLAADLG